MRHVNFNYMLCAILRESCTARLADFGDRYDVWLDKQKCTGGELERLACQTVVRFGEGPTRSLGLKGCTGCRR